MPLFQAELPFLPTHNMPSIITSFWDGMHLAESTSGSIISCVGSEEILKNYNIILYETKFGNMKNFIMSPF